jgi:cystathionine beta-lyase/cystathionine gamma-synthase
MEPNSSVNYPESEECLELIVSSGCIATLLIKLLMLKSSKWLILKHKVYSCCFSLSRMILIQLRFEQLITSTACQVRFKRKLERNGCTEKHKIF